MALYFAYHNKIVAMDPAGKSVLEVTNTSEASGLDFHLNSNSLFYADTEARKVYKLKLPNNNDIFSGNIAASSLNPIPLVEPPNTGAWSPSAVAVDWIGNNLYIVDSLGQKVNIYDIDGLYWTIVVSSNLSSPVDIALDPLMGVMFITDNNRVVRANMDGTHLVPLVEDAVYKASGLSLDLTTRRVFWSDILLDYIETVDYNGQNRQQIIRGPTNVPAPSRIAVFERSVYWTDGSKQGVFVVDKFAGASTKKSIYSMATQTGKEPKAIKAVHPLVQPEGYNPCKQNDCEHLCIVTSTTPELGSEPSLGYKCACDIGYRLKPNRKGCIRVTEFLMYSQQKFIKGKVLDPVSSTFNDAIPPIVSRSARFVGLDFDAYQVG